VRWTEAPLELVECFNPETNTCRLAGACHLSRGLQRALRAFLSVLDDLTIADIAFNRDMLLERLGLHDQRPAGMAPSLPATGPAAAVAG
jgi:Rrf2 family nitric oxide-sensitive transcriptional repressor